MNICILLELFLLLLSVFYWISLYFNKNIASEPQATSITSINITSKQFCFLVVTMLTCILVLPNAIFVIAKLCLPNVSKYIIMAGSMVGSELFTLFLVTKIYYGLNNNEPIFQLCDLEKSKSGIGYFLLSLPIVYAVSAAWLLFLMYLQSIGWKIDLQAQSALQLFTESPKEIKVLLGFSIAFLAPFIEECFFRGILYRVFKAKTSKSSAIIWSSLVFAALHMNLVAAVPIFALGIFLAKSYEHTGNLISSMTMHALFNLNTLLCLLLSAQDVV